MFKNIFKFLTFTLPLILTGHKPVFADEPTQEPEAGRLPEYNTGSYRKLLTSPPYEVDNGASSGANSFPSALSYVNSLGGTQSLTFGSGSYNQTCLLTSTISMTNPIIFDLAGLSPAGFSINGGNTYYDIKATGSKPAILSVVSSSGSGSLSFISSGFSNSGSGNMTTTVSTGVTLALERSSIGSVNSGNMITNIYGTLSMSGGGLINGGTDSMITNVYGNMSMTNNAVLDNFGKNMTTNIYGTLILLQLSVFVNDGSGDAVITVYNGGDFSLDTGSQMQFTQVLIMDGGTFISGIGGGSIAGAYFYASSLRLASGAIHQAIIGTGSLPVEIMSLISLNSTAFLGSSTLNVVSSQNLNELKGHNFTIMTTDQESIIFENYGLLQFNGSPLNLPYNVYYTPSPTSISNVIVSFPTGLPVYAPTLAPSQAATAQPSFQPSASPLNIPTVHTTTIPSFAPTAPPVIPAYKVNSVASSGANSFPAALSYVDGLGGTQSIMFGSGVYGQMCNLTGTMTLANPLTIDLAGLGSGGFSINGISHNNYNIFASAGRSAGLTFISSSGSGTFSFINSGFSHSGFGNMTTTVDTGATVVLLSGSTFSNSMSSAVMITNVNPGASLILSGGVFFNQGSGTLTTVNTGATLALSASSFLLNYGSGSSTATINSGGLLSIDGADFYGIKVTIEGEATFASSIRGAYFHGSPLTLSPTAIHEAAIGSHGGYVQMITMVSPIMRTSVATLGGATLNVESSQGINSLAGNTYIIMAVADTASSILGQYGALQWNGSPICIPYTVSYTPSPTSINSVSVVFPSTIVCNPSSTPGSPTSSPSVPGAITTIAPTAITFPPTTINGSEAGGTSEASSSVDGGKVAGIVIGVAGTATIIALAVIPATREAIISFCSKIPDLFRSPQQQMPDIENKTTADNADNIAPANPAAQNTEKLASASSQSPGAANDNADSVVDESIRDIVSPQRAGLSVGAEGAALEPDAYSASYLHHSTEPAAVELTLMGEQ